MLIAAVNESCCAATRTNGYATPNSHIRTAVAYALREHKLHQAAASTFAAVRLKLEAKLFRDLPPPPQQQQQQQKQQGDLSQAFPLPVLLSLSSLPSSHRSVRGSSSSSSRLPLRLDIPRDASHHMHKFNPFTTQASCNSSAYIHTHTTATAVHIYTNILLQHQCTQ
jgi:hypothetical protein